MTTDSVAVPQAVLDAITFLGGPSAVARKRGVTAQAVSKWTRQGLPSDQVIWLASETGWRFSPNELAGNLYPHPDDGLPVELRGLTAYERIQRAPPRLKGASRAANDVEPARQQVGQCAKRGQFS